MIDVIVFKKSWRFLAIGCALSSLFWLLYIILFIDDPRFDPLIHKYVLAGCLGISLYMPMLLGVVIWKWPMSISDRKSRKVIMLQSYRWAMLLSVIILVALIVTQLLANLFMQWMIFIPFGITLLLILISSLIQKIRD